MENTYIIMSEWNVAKKMSIKSACRSQIEMKNMLLDIEGKVLLVMK